MAVTMSAFEPLVTIVIPVYNGQDFLADAIDSALSQSYGNIEVIVVNDGSTDQTEEIAKSYGKKVRYFYKTNGGCASALNFAIKRAKGRYISWLSHDDLYFFDKIEQQVEVLTHLQNRNSIVISNYVQFSTSCVRHSDLLSCTEREPLENFRLCKVDCIDSQKICKSTVVSFLFGGIINGCTLLIPKELFDKVGYFNEELLTTQDYDMWFRFVQSNVDFVFADHYVVKSRQHEKQGTITQAHICKKEECLLFKKAGIVFFGVIARMDRTLFRPVRWRLRRSKSWFLLFCLILLRCPLRFCARIMDKV